MNIIIQQLELIARIDQLIRMEATGTPVALASRLEVSKTTLYRMINTMKALKAPIVYDHAIQSFTYEEPVEFNFGFYEYQLVS